MTMTMNHAFTASFVVEMAFATDTCLSSRIIIKCSRQNTHTGWYLVAELGTYVGIFLTLIV